MMLGVIGSKRIGITVDQLGVRYVTVKKRKTWEIGSSGYLPIPSGIIVEEQIVNAESLSLQVKQWVKQQNLKGATATIAIPTSQIIIRKMRIPSIKTQELRQLVELEVETALRLPFEDPIYDFIQVSHDDESTQVLVFAAPKKLIMSYVRVFEDAGVHVRAAEISATALTRAIAAQQEEFFEETMLVSLDQGALEVYMLQNGNPIFMRTITLFEHDTDDHEELTSDQVGEIIAEISRMLSFYQYSIQEGTSRISHIVVTGANKGRIQLHKELQQSLSELKVETVDFDVFSKERSNDFNANAYRVAVGVSMFTKRNAQINLLPHRKTETKVKLFLLILFVFAWVAGMALSGMTYVNNQKSMTQNTARIAQLNQTKKVAEAKITKKPENQTDPASFIAATRANRKDVVAIVNELKKPLPMDAQISTMAYSAESQITLTVLFAKMEDSARYLFDLRRLSFGENTLLQSITETTSGSSTNNTGTNNSNAAADQTGSTNSTTPTNNLQTTKYYTVNYTISFKKEAAKDTSAKANTEVKGADTTNVQQK
ncbi:pilus assembly protein PilM [Paenibacillus sp. N3.4]|uniref:pilus assembly protein PilM n=1 Tax=Paenibacillus sp. N3.4 TaxID=2603222 RepID=UPI0011C8D299|nr:pilus assembly protein PilM [Paenibacillus sp. N3.4]TXK85391.1 fimbrial protein [Paenibacillus sp. N3.4]